MVGAYRQNVIKVYPGIKNIPLESALRMGALPKLVLKNPVQFGKTERDRLLNDLRANKAFSKNDKIIIESAVNLAHDEHNGQIRKATNYPYEIHPNGMTRFLIGLQLSDVDLFTATPIHDVVEDATLGIPGIERMDTSLRHSFGYNRLAQKFPKRVASVVMELTKTDTRFDSTGIPCKLSLEEQQQSISFLMKNGSIRAVIIKLVDRLYNLTDIHNIPLSSLYNQTHETLQIMIPAIEERLKIGPTKEEIVENGSTLSAEFYKAANDLLELLKWQTLVASVAYYRMCKISGFEPVSLSDPFDKDWYKIFKQIKTVNPYGDIGEDLGKPKKRYRI
jgi:(p)ppGpp synthase/HD superfamily hydrolase